MARLSSGIALSIAVGFFWWTDSAAGAQIIHTIALSGQHAPETIGNVRFNGFSAPQLSSDGKLAFGAGLDGDGVCCGSFGGTYNNTGIWTGDAGSLSLVMRAGDQAAGVDSGTLYTHYYSPSSTAFAFSNNGNLAFNAGLLGPDVENPNCCGVWSVSNQSTNLVFRSGDHVPGMPANVTFDADEGVFKVDSAGQLIVDFPLLKDGIRNYPRTNVIWTGSAVAGSLIATEGEHAPGMAADVSFFYFNPPGNSAAHVAFHATLIGGGFDLANSEAIWSNRSGSLARVAQVNGQAPGMPNGVTFASVGDEALLNANDNIAFIAGLKGPGVGDSNEAIWSDVGGSLAPLVQTGQPAPGTPSGVTFDRFFNAAMNNSGKLAFNAYLSGSEVGGNFVGIWSNNAGPLRLLARKGDVVPGMNGVVWEPYDVVLNDAGQAAFHADLIDTAANYTSTYSLWAQDKAGNLHLIVRQGGQIEVAPGDLRIVRSFEDWMDTNGDGSAAAFNEKGQYAFYASFTDGTSGIFVSDVAAVPEPGCILSFAVPAIGLTAKRRRANCK